MKKRKRGGQPKPASQRKRHSLTIRVLDELRLKLEEAAEKSQRSVSEEAAHRMRLAFNLESELTDYRDIQKSNDDTIKNIMVQRGWGKVVDVRYGGPVFIPPGQIQGLPTSGFKDPAELETPPNPAITSALFKAIQDAVEKGVAAALSRATLRIGEDK